MAAMHEASLLRGRFGGAGMRNSTLKIALDARRATRGGPAAIAVRQQARLAELVAFARTCSPYYRRLYKDLPADVCDPRLLPPVTILHDEAAMAVYNAIGYTRAMPALLSRNDLWRLLRSGARSAAVYATGGHFFAAAVLERRLKQRPWRARMQRVFSVLSPLAGIVRDLNAFRPSLLASYPSMLESLAEEQEAGRLQIRPVLISAGGETLAPKVREHIADAFGCPVRDVYGSSEAVGITYECGYRWLHVSADWYIFEPVDRNYRLVLRGEPSHTVLMTNLANRVQPLIRYDQGDSVTLRPDACPCGSPLPAIRVVGRTNDTLSFQTDNAGQVKLLPLALGTVIEETPDVRRFQAIKTGPELIEVRLETSLGADPEKVWNAIERRLREYLSAQGAASVAVKRSQRVPHAGQAPAGSRDAIFELDDRLLGYAVRCLVGGKRAHGRCSRCTASPADEFCRTAARTGRCSAPASAQQAADADRTGRLRQDQVVHRAGGWRRG